MKYIVMCLQLLLIAACTAADNQADVSENATQDTIIVGGGCDGCELMFVDMPDNINTSDTSAAWRENDYKLKIMGQMYQLDGRTPAENVILYYWHTDKNGHYTPSENQNPQTRRHGKLRGWVRTDDAGKFMIHTIKPASYPGTDEPAHIHFAVKEPDIANEYYIDEMLFEDDPNLEAMQAKRPNENRGGSGIVRLSKESDYFVAQHTIILGLNIPDYPQKSR